MLKECMVLDFYDSDSDLSSCKIEFIAGVDEKETRRRRRWGCANLHNSESNNLK